MYEFLGTAFLFLFKATIATAIGWGLHGYIVKFGSFKELLEDLFQ